MASWEFLLPPINAYSTCLRNVIVVDPARTTSKSGTNSRLKLHLRSYYSLCIPILLGILNS